MAVSREVDLTRHLDFKDQNKKLKSVNLKDPISDYKRYHKMRSSNSSTISYKDFDLNNSASVTSTLNTVFDNILHKDIIYIEERICWRKLQNDPYVYEQHFTHKDWEERLKNWNFPLGSKYDRQRARYEQLREAEIQLAGICDCCGKKINYNNCLSYHYAMCQKCLEKLNNRIDSISLKM